MTRIAFFSGDITRGGGTERVGTLIANQLAKKAEYQVFFLSLTHQNERPVFEIDKSISKAAFSEHWISPGLGYLKVIWRMIPFLRKHKIDIVIDIDGVLDVLSIPAKFFTHVRLISWEHFNFYNGSGMWYRRRIRKLAARYADAIVTLTNQDKAYYEKNLNIRHRIQAIHNPIDYMKPGKDWKARDFKKKVILSVGRLTEEKNFVRIPHMVARMREKYPELSFVWQIAGSGEQEEEIQKEILRWKVSDYVQLTGFVENIEKLYEEALVYVMTSKYEGLPMVLLEAKMHQIPCVSFDIATGPAEIIQDKIDGYLIPYEENAEKVSEEMVDCIAELLSNQEKYHAFCSHTQDNIALFRTDYVMGQWEKLIADILA